MSGPGDTRGRGVLGHDRGSPHTLVLVVLLIRILVPGGTPVTAGDTTGSDTGTTDNRTFDTGNTTNTGVRA